MKKIFNLRNKRGAEAFYLTNNIEKNGSGFIRIRKALQDYPETAFEINDIENEPSDELLLLHEWTS